MAAVCARFSAFRWPLLALAGVGLLVVLAQCLRWDGQVYMLFKQHRQNPALQQANIWLPGYRAVLQGKPLLGLEHDETSGLTYSPYSNTLFTVTGKNPQMIELSLEGEILRRIRLLGFSNPEGVEVVAGGRLAIIDERQHKLTLFSLDEHTTSIDGRLFQSVDLGFADAGNKGFEGIAWDAGRQRLLLGKERGPLGLFSLPFPGEDGATGVMQAQPSGNLLVRDISSLSFDARSGHVLVLSDESQLLLELDAQGEPVSFISLIGGFSGLTHSIKQAEGVTMDAAGDIYIVSEPNLFYRLRKGKPGDRPDAD